MLYGDAPVLLLANTESSDLLKTLINNGALESLANTLAGDIQLPGERSYWKRFADGFGVLRIACSSREVLKKERAVEKRNQAEISSEILLKFLPLTVLAWFWL